MKEDLMLTRRVLMRAMLVAVLKQHEKSLQEMMDKFPKTKDA
jgi:hypothetical protein